MKIMFYAALACFALFTSSLMAETIAANDVSSVTLKTILSKKYNTEMDSDGDIVINQSGKIFVTVKRKSKLIRIHCGFVPYDKRSKKEMINLANKFNSRKVFLRVSINEKGSSYCDYYIIYDGGVNSENLLEAVAWMIHMRDSWEKFVLQGGFDD